MAGFEGIYKVTPGFLFVNRQLCLHQKLRISEDEKDRLPHLTPGIENLTVLAYIQNPVIIEFMGYIIVWTTGAHSRFDYVHRIYES